MSAIGPKRTSLVAPHMSAFGGKADIGPPALQDLSGTGLVREPAYLGQPSCCRHWLETCSSVKRYYSPSWDFHAQLTCGHCNHDRGGDCRARSNSGYRDFWVATL